MAENHEPLADLWKIDALCDRFEEAWHSLSPLALDALLPDVREDCRTRLFEELLALEIELRKLDGESPDSQEYVAKYPQFAKQIATRFSEATTRGKDASSALATLRPAIDSGDRLRCPDDAKRGPSRPGTIPEPSSRLGRFELLARLGEGGFATVWKAYDPLLKRLVALKIPRHRQVCPHDTTAAIHEARAAARLRHPAVVQVYEVGEEGDAVYIASEYFKGGSLRDYVSEHRMPADQVARLGIRLADALHHAHSMGIIHRDLKPSNILLDGAHSASIGDFGLAFHPDRQDGAEHEPSVLGTLAYMPPEQASGNARSVDCRADVYSLGVVLYELLTGKRPFEGDGEALRRAVLQEHASSPRRWNPEVPRDLAAICLKCLEKAPERRYASAEDLGLDLLRFLRGDPVSARKLSAPRSFWRWCRRKPALAAIMVLVILLVTTVVAGSVVYSVRTADLLRTARTNLYFHRILAAQHSWHVNDVDYFRSLLEECPEDLRKWEWHYLNQLPRLADKTLELAGGWVVYSPDGSRMATAGCEKAVKVWDAQTGKLLFALGGHQSFPCAAAFSPDGGRIVSAGGSDRMAVLWDLATRRPVALFRGHEGPVVGVRFSPDGRHVVSASLDKTIRIWDVATHREIRRLKHDGRVWTVDISPDGSLIASASGKGRSSSIQFWEFGSGKRIWEVPGSGRQADVAFSPDGRRLAVGDGLAVVRLFDVASRQPVLSIATTVGRHPHVTFHPDGLSLASNQWDHSIKIWDSATGAELRTIRGQTAPVQSLAFRPRGTELAFGTTRDFVFVYDTRDEPGVVTLRGHQARISTIAFSADGSHLASGSEDGSLRLWSPDSRGPSQVLARLSSPIRCATFSPDSSQLAVTSDDSTVQVWDVLQRQPVLKFTEHFRPIQAIVYSPDGSRIASAGRGRVVKVWDPRSGEVSSTLSIEERDVRSLAFSPCGQWLAAAGRGHRVEMWRLDSEEVEFTYDCEHPAYQVKFHPAGQTLAISTSEGAIHFWEFQKGLSHVRFSKKGNRSRTTIAYSADGARFVTASEQDAVRLWDLTHERQVLTLAEGGDVAGIATFSPCGRYIAAVWANDIKVWKQGTEPPRPNNLSPGEGAIGGSP